MDIKKYSTIISFLIIIAAVYLSFYSLTPESNVTFNNFSIERALEHVKKMSLNPHFTGSPEHKNVRNYLINELEKLGLEVEIQEQFAINKKWRAATKVKNIIAKIPGTERGKSLVLLSHYDSNPHSSLGASDAASGVAIILEGITSFLKTKKQSKNDIIICFTDAEELGLLGANAFVNHHRWAKNVGLVLNFEARGSGGPSYMFVETNGGNKNLINAFNEANTPYPVANSLMYSIYKLLPNDTDLTVFRENGNNNGFNFAFIGDHFDYHTQQDTFERMDLQSFNHQVSYFLATFNYFSNANLNNLDSASNLVYFNFPYFGLITYPYSWVYPLIFIGLISFLLLLCWGLFKKEITLKGIFNGFIPLTIAFIISIIFAVFGWKLIKLMHPQYNDILHGFTYNGYYYIGAFTAITVAICFWIYCKYFKKNSLQDLIIAPLTIWLLLNIILAVYLKGASFFIFPVFVMLLFLGWLLKSKSQNIIYTTIISVPVVIVFSPFVKMFPVGLGLNMLSSGVFFTVLLFVFLVPVFYNFRNTKKLAWLFFGLSLVLLVISSFKSNYSDKNKLPNSILYIVDSNTNKAYWASYNQKADAFTKQFLGENPTQGGLDTNIFSSKYKTKINLIAPAELKEFKKPVISLVKDTIVGNERLLTLQIESLRNANRIEVLAKTPITFSTFTVNRESFTREPDIKANFYVEKGTVMSYFFTEENEVVEINFSINKKQKIAFDVIEAKYDLFSNSQFSINPRLNYMMPMPFVLNDATVIKTTINL